MNSMSPKDASLLALIAENPRMSGTTLNRLLADIEDKQVREVAEVLARVPTGATQHSDVAVKAAEELRRWAQSNREQHSSPSLARR